MPLVSIAALGGLWGCGESSNSDSDDSALPQADQPDLDEPETVEPEPEPGESVVGNPEDRSCSGLSLSFMNLDAESIDPATSEDQFGVLDSWELMTGNTSSTPYGSGGYPTAGEGQGSRLFTGGYEALSVAHVTTDLSANVAGCRFVFSADIGGFAQQEDNATVEIAYMGSSEEVLSALEIGPITAGDRQGETALLPVEATGTIPDTAVQARITITQIRVSGTANDGYVDNIAIALE